MKYAFVVALSLLAATAQAATPEADYLAARNAFIAKLNPPGKLKAPTDAQSNEMERARKQLAGRMRSLIGPLNVKGFSGEGTYNVGSLFRGDMEFGVLDGLLFTKDKDVQLVVTTMGLAARWAKSTEGMIEKGDKPPELREAMKLELFYTRATQIGAAVGDYGELPVSRPSGVDFVFAMLSGRRQDTLPVTPEEVLVGMIVPPRVYVVSMPAVAKIKVMAACEKLWKDADAKAGRIERSKGVAVDPQNIRDKGEEATRKCFATRARSDPAFASIVKQAQEMVDTLATK